MMKSIKLEILFGSILCGSYFLCAMIYFFFGSEPVANMQLELLAPLAGDFVLGTDVYGRSLFKMLSAGVLHSLSFAFITAFSSAIIGVVAGGIMALAGNKISTIIETIT